MSVKQGSQYVKHCGLGYRKGCVVRINMVSSEECKSNIEKIFEHFPEQLKGVRYTHSGVWLSASPYSLLGCTVPVQPSKVEVCAHPPFRNQPFWLRETF